MSFCKKNDNEPIKKGRIKVKNLRITVDKRASEFVAPKAIDKAIDVDSVVRRPAGKNDMAPPIPIAVLIKTACSYDRSIFRLVYIRKSKTLSDAHIIKEHKIAIDNDEDLFMYLRSIKNKL